MSKIFFISTFLFIFVVTNVSLSHELIPNIPGCYDPIVIRQVERSFINDLENNPMDVYLEFLSRYGHITDIEKTIYFY